MAGWSFTINQRERKPFRDLIYEELRLAICRGHFKRGDRLVEQELAAQLKVSRTPVREALRKLEVEGLVEHIPHKGVVVKGFNESDIVEIFAIRAVLEGLAARYAALRISQEQRESLKLLLDDMTQSLADGDLDKHLQQVREFNDVIISVSGMPRLNKLISTLQIYSEGTRQVTLADAQRREQALREHRLIYQAIAAGNGEEAERLAREHTIAAQEVYLRNI